MAWARKRTLSVAVAMTLAAAAGARLWVASLPSARELADPVWIQGQLDLKEWIQLQSLPPALVDSVLMHEDDGFYGHGGVDWPSLGRAAVDNLASGRYRRGASTLTQQLVRNVYLGPEKTLHRKAKELILASRAEENLEKAQILEAWFNVAEFYPGYRGIGEGSRRWFKLEPARLNARQAVFLSVILPDPRRGLASLRRGSATGWMEAALEKGLRQLKRRGVLDTAAFDQACDSPLWPAPVP